MDTLMYSLGYLLFLYIPTKEALHIFQQNHYHLDRYHIWLQDKTHEHKHHSYRFFLLFLPMFALLCIATHPHIRALEALLFFIYAYVMMKIDDEKTYIKPFVYTPRILRQITFQYLLYIGILFLLCKANATILLLVTPFLYFLPWIMVSLSGFCMRYLEQQIQMYYVNDAKRILNKHTNLIKIGITGSYGKTSVKTILQELIGNRYYSLMTPNSYNNLMGITLTIRGMLRSIHEVFICEMGADHVREIEQLASFVQPNIGIVTAVGPQHLQTFHTIDNILQEKMQLIEQLPSNGIAFLNKDNAYIRSYRFSKKPNIIWFSVEQPSDFQAKDIRYHEQGMTFTLYHEQQQVVFETKLLGEHNVRNIVTAIAVASTLGIPMNLLQKSVRQLPYVEHRLQLRKTPTFTLLDNAYNSNPEGAKEALEVLYQMPGKHIVITPGFIELGKMEEEAHHAFGKQLSKCADIVILIGPIQTKAIRVGLQRMNYPQEQMYTVSSTTKAIALANQLASEKDTVLIENDLPDAFNH